MVNRYVLILFVALALIGSTLTHTVSSQEPTPTPSASPSPTPTESPVEDEPSPTPTPSQIDKVELHQALVDLSSLATVMCVAAHPDDEDGTTLTVLRRKSGIHTVTLFSTYGEGGQNAVGPELYEELGVIRAQETLKAAEIQGSEAHFLGLKDFGFSKSADETFKIWNHDEALKRMVLKIRELRPDVIITNHDTTSGHGHHQATGRLVLEAFDAAADPDRFPEQLKQKPGEPAISVWQVKRLFVRFRRAATAETPVTDKLVVVDPNEKDPVRGTSYGEQALTALQQHASQGPWPKSISEWLRFQNNQTGKLNLIRYRLAREAQGVPTLPDGAAAFIEAIAFPQFVQDLLAPGTAERSVLKVPLEETETILDGLIDWRVRDVPSAPAAEMHRMRLFDARISKALAVATGTTLSLNSPNRVIVPGSTGQFTVNLANAGSRFLRVHRVALDLWVERLRLDAADQLLPDTETVIPVERAMPKTTQLTVPRPDHLYDGSLFGKRFVAEADLDVYGARFRVTKELKMDVVPAVEIKSIGPGPYVWTPGTSRQPLTLKLLLTNNSGRAFRGLAKVKSSMLNIHEFGQEISLGVDETREVVLQPGASIAGRVRGGRQNSAIATVTIEESDSRELVTQRALPVIYSNAVVAQGRRIGYVPSFDQTLETALAALGVESKALTMEEVQQGGLSVYDTIIIDNRGYEAHPELVAANTRLLDYVQAGGTMIVFYHKDDEWNPDEKKSRPQLAPYPIMLNSSRVTEETAQVRFLQPHHQLMRFPNRITSADFDNWIQERGLYYPKEWEPKYVSLFSSNDLGEKPLTGGLLVARYGKGNYIYTSMVWYRQLRAGVPGGYRMFANMISYGRRRIVSSESR